MGRIDHLPVIHFPQRLCMPVLMGPFILQPMALEKILFRLRVETRKASNTDNREGSETQQETISADQPLSETLIVRQSPRVQHYAVWIAVAMLSAFSPPFADMLVSILYILFRGFY